MNAHNAWIPWRGHSLIFIFFVFCFLLLLLSLFLLLLMIIYFLSIHILSTDLSYDNVSVRRIFATSARACLIRLNHPIPTHSIQMLIAFVNTTASSPREIPYPIKQAPTSIRITAGHLLFHILLVFDLLIYFSSVTFFSSFSTISFHSSRLWLPE